MIRGMKKIVIAGGLLASTVLLSSCGLAGLGGPSNQDTVSYEVTDKVARLHVESGAGDTVITETGGSAIRVVETLQWRGDKPNAEHSVDGDTLFVRYECAQDWGGCSVNYKIEIPKGLQVDAETGSGDITLRSLTGPLNVTAGSGDVDASGLAGKKVVAEAGSGNIELKYTTAPDIAELKAGSGDVTLRVPEGSYDVKTEVGSGDTAVTVGNDPASPRKLSLTTGSGNISVLPA